MAEGKGVREEKERRREGSRVSVEQLIAIGVTDPTEQANLLGFDAQQAASSPKEEERRRTGAAANEEEGGTRRGAAANREEAASPAHVRSAARDVLQRRPGPCENCGKVPSDRAGSTQFLSCSNCRSADYCSIDCQRKHWIAAHRAVCAARQQKHARGGAEEAAVAPGGQERAAAASQQGKGGGGQARSSSRHAA